MKLLLILLLTTVCFSLTKSQHFLPGRSVIVQLFEWKWIDVALECERWLAPNGFAAVQISPPTENIIAAGRPWWERNQPISYLFTTRSGTESELLDMVQRCNAVGVRVYAEVILNHMTGPSLTEVTGTGGSIAYPATKDYPAVPYSSLDFNAECDVTDYTNAANVRNCEVLDLKDLDQSKIYVTDKMTEMLNRLVDMGIAGFYVATAKHIWPDDLENIFKRLNDLNSTQGFHPGTRPFSAFEVIDMEGSGEAVTRDQYVHLGRVTEYRFSYEISRAFMGNNELKWFINWGEDWLFVNRYYSLTFVDNHDLQRNPNIYTLTYKTPQKYVMATAFHLAHPYGFPRIMSSYDFTNNDAGPPSDANFNTISPEINPDNSCTNNWICEHRWNQIVNMVKFRNTVEGTDLTQWWDNGNNQIAFCRGQNGFIAFNNDIVDLSQTLQTCLPEGTYCDVISGTLQTGSCTGKSVTVAADGTAVISILTTDAELVLALHINAKL